MNESSNPLSRQVGGSHYAGHRIQPVQYAMGARMSYVQGAALKYVTRPRKGQVRDDIAKCLHYLDFDAQRKWSPIEPSDFIRGLSDDVPDWMRTAAMHICFLPFEHADSHRELARMVLENQLRKMS